MTEEGEIRFLCMESKASEINVIFEMLVSVYSTNAVW